MASVHKTKKSAWRQMKHFIYFIVSLSYRRMFTVTVCQYKNTHPGSEWEFLALRPFGVWMLQNSCQATLSPIIRHREQQIQAELFLLLSSQKRRGQVLRWWWESTLLINTRPDLCPIPQAFQWAGRQARLFSKVVYGGCHWDVEEHVVQREAETQQSPGGWDVACWGQRSQAASTPSTAENPAWKKEGRVCASCIDCGEYHSQHN